MAGGWERGIHPSRFGAHCLDWEASKPLSGQAKPYSKRNDKPLLLVERMKAATPEVEWGGLLSLIGLCKTVVEEMVGNQ